MKIITNAKSLMTLFKDYRTMTHEDLEDFYQSKCDYYQDYVGISLIAGSVCSLLYIISDYFLNGSYIPTLIPRFSIIFFIILFLVVTNNTKERTTTVLIDYILGHAVVIATI